MRREYWNLFWIKLATKDRTTSTVRPCVVWFGHHRFCQAALCMPHLLGRAIKQVERAAAFCRLISKIQRLEWNRTVNIVIIVTTTTERIEGHCERLNASSTCPGINKYFQVACCIVWAAVSWISDFLDIRGMVWKLTFKTRKDADKRSRFKILLSNCGRWRSQWGYRKDVHSSGERVSVTVTTEDNNDREG